MSATGGLTSMISSWMSGMPCHHQDDTAQDSDQLCQTSTRGAKLIDILKVQKGPFGNFRAPVPPKPIFQILAAHLKP